MKRTLFLDILAAACALVILIGLIVYLLPDYLERNDPDLEPTPMISRVTDSEAGIENLPCTLTADGC